MVGTLRTASLPFQTAVAQITRVNAENVPTRTWAGLAFFVSISYNNRIMTTVITHLTAVASPWRTALVSVIAMVASTQTAMFSIRAVATSTTFRNGLVVLLSHFLEWIKKKKKKKNCGLFRVYNHFRKKYYCGYGTHNSLKAHFIASNRANIFKSRYKGEPQFSINYSFSGYLRLHNHRCNSAIGLSGNYSFANKSSDGLS